MSIRESMTEIFRGLADWLDPNPGPKGEPEMPELTDAEWYDRAPDGVVKRIKLVEHDAQRFMQALTDANPELFEEDLDE